MKKAIFPIVILALTWGSLLAQEKPQDLDTLLQKELGVSPSSSSKTSESNANESSNSNKSDSSPIESSQSNSNGNGENSDLIQDRYSDTEDSSSTAWLLVKVIFVFGGLTAVMMFVLRVMTRTRDSRFPVKGVMSVLSSLPIAPNKQLQIVDVAGKLLVLGVADSGVSYITEITSLEDKNRIMRLKQEFEPSQDNFMVTLLESLKDLSPKSLINRSEQNESETKFIDDQDFAELEKKHKSTMAKLKESNKDLGMDPGLSGGKL